jgi:hypothetical protein
LNEYGWEKLTGNKKKRITERLRNVTTKESTRINENDIILGKYKQQLDICPALEERPTHLLEKKHSPNL